MKQKRILLPVFGLLCLLLLAGCGEPKELNENVSASPQNASSETLTADDAKEIALAHCGIAEGDAQFVTVETDAGDGCYEVEFYVGTTEYDYEIDAITGDILSYDRDIEDFEIPGNGKNSGHHGKSNGDNGHHSQTNCTNNVVLSADDAKAIALAHAGLTESDVTALQVGYDHDDGHHEYEVEFHKGAMEYDYEIAGCTGEILSYDTDNH